jgi:hypothetical protein
MFRVSSKETATGVDNKENLLEDIYNTFALLKETLMTI